MDYQNLTDEQLREQADKAVIENTNGQWTIHFDRQIPGLDFSKSYPSRDQAVDDVYNGLKKFRTRAA